MTRAMIPRRGGFRDQICQSVAAFGPMTLTGIARHFVNSPYGTTVRAVHSLKFYKTLVLDNGIYSLSPKAAVHYGVISADELDVEPAPVVVPVSIFRPLSAKNMAWLVHADRLRQDASYKNCSDGHIRRAA